MGESIILESSHQCAIESPHRFRLISTIRGGFTIIYNGELIGTYLYQSASQVINEYNLWRSEFERIGVKDSDTADKQTLRAIAIIIRARPIYPSGTPSEAIQFIQKWILVRTQENLADFESDMFNSVYESHPKTAAVGNDLGPSPIPFSLISGYNTYAGSLCDYLETERGFISCFIQAPGQAQPNWIGILLSRLAQFFETFGIRR